MNSLRRARPALEGLEPYDPKYLPADVILSANESPATLPSKVAAKVQQALAAAVTNRYADPLANTVRDALAQAHGLSRDNVLVGSGGDELIFDLVLAWGGSGRTMLNLPPTFGSYASFAQLVGTKVVDVPRLPDFSIDESAVLKRVARGDIDFVVVCSPNNPSGDLARLGFIEQLLDTTDALVLVDEAYFEFSGQTALNLLAAHENLAILRTFSKAYRLAGVRVGYLLTSQAVVRELCKVRMPYSVGVYQQAAALVCCNEREVFEQGIQETVRERKRVFDALDTCEGIEVFPSHANYLLVRIPQANQVWQQLLDRGILVRDFSAGEYTHDCLRVSIGSPEQNDALLVALSDIVQSRA